MLTDCDGLVEEEEGVVQGVVVGEDELEELAGAR